jgi:hypothetical protein
MARIIAHGDGLDESRVTELALAIARPFLKASFGN